MNWIDLVILGALGFSLLSGYQRGAMMQAFSWGGLLIGLMLGGALSPRIVELVKPSSGAARVTIAMGALFGISFLVETGFSVAGHRVRKRIRAPLTHRIDAVAGCVVGGVFVIGGAWLLGVMLKQGPSPQLAGAIKESAILSWTDDLAPRPPGWLAEIGRFLGRTGFPEVFAQLNPSLAPGIDPPPPELARHPRILAAAGLTYKIESTGCGGLVDGSGFPAEPRLVVTAAHVVAGTRGTRIIEPDGDSFRATVVYMDTRKDIAILRVPTLPASRVLGVEGDRAPRGTDGAAIGYPGGGPRTISVARVRARTEAVGRDIYSRALVNRVIYVLNATVRRGNSGGPFVDTKGRVRGMIFAAAAERKSESYALTESEIEIALSRSRARTRAVSTGSCAV